MSSIVLDLQRDATDEQIAVQAILRTSYVIARKLAINDLASWAEAEMKGYGTGEAPDYRLVRGTPKVYNPFRGLMPLMCRDPVVYAEMCTMLFNQSVGELERLLSDGEEDWVNLSYAPDRERMYMSAMNFELQPLLQISKTEIYRILNAVRKLVLDWALKLEADGVLGEGMVFSNSEKGKVNAVTYNVKTMLQGNFHQAQVQVESNQSTQSRAEFPIDLAELRQIICELEEVKNLGGEAKAELAAEIGTLKSQCESPKPKAGIVKESLGSVRRILEEAGGNLLAAGLLPSLTRLLGAF